MSNGRETTVEDRTAAYEQAFAEAPRAQLPAEVQQIVIDERPRGAISVHVKRDELEVLRKIKVIASAAGDDFFYSWPTKNRDGTKGVVEGPSVKCANAVSRIFGNCSVKVRVFDQGTHWIFYAQFYDLETGFVLERPFQQRKNQKTGMGDADRQSDIVFQIGTSKAARNVVCNALSEFTDYAFAVAKEQLVEKIGKNLDKFRAQVLERLVTLKVDLKRVETVRGKVAKDWLAPDIAKTIAEIQGVNDGMAHPDELWPAVAGGGGAAPAERPKVEDYQAGQGGEAGKGTETGQAQPQPAQQPQPAAAPATEAPKPEPAPAPAQAPQASDPPAGEQRQGAAPAGGASESDAGGAAAGHGGDSSQVVPEGPTAAEKALEGAEAALQRGIDNLLSLSTVELIDQHAPSVTALLAEFEDLDPEDLALLLNRWKSAQLERKRDIARKSKRR